MAASSAALARDLVAELCALLVEVSDGKLQGNDIDPAANLFDFGYVDSLSGVMFLARIEEQWGVHIEDFDLVERLNSIEAVAAHLVTSR
jgi:acyl carrier protein